MIKFFRHIRQQLLSEGKTGKYLKYAIGEIVLVVIGILIALQINNWNETRKDIKKSRAILGEFIKDLASDTTGISRVVKLLERQTRYEVWALNRVVYDTSQIDSLKNAFFSTVYQEFVQDRTYNKLQVSQNPNLTGFLDLQSALTQMPLPNLVKKQFPGNMPGKNLRLAIFGFWICFERNSTHFYPHNFSVLFPKGDRQR